MLEEPWTVFAIVGVGLIILEIFTPSFFMLPAGLAFLATAALSPLLPNLTTTLAVLAVNLVVTYAAFQRLVWPRVQKAAPRTAASGMIGKTATVTEAVRPDAPGYVKLYGDSWQALASEELEVGTRVVIVGIEGNKVVVERPRS